MIAIAQVTRVEGRYADDTIAAVMNILKLLAKFIIQGSKRLFYIVRVMH